MLVVASIFSPCQQTYPRYSYMAVLHFQFSCWSYFWSLPLLWCRTASGFLAVAMFVVDTLQLRGNHQVHWLCKFYFWPEPFLASVSITAASFWMICFSWKSEASFINSANFTHSSISFSFDNFGSFDDLDLCEFFDALEFPLPLSEILLLLLEDDFAELVFCGVFLNQQCTFLLKEHVWVSI